jgi:hypothetical protein
MEGGRLLGFATTVDDVIGGVDVRGKSAVVTGVARTELGALGGPIDLVVLDLATFAQRAISACLDKSSKEY